MSTAADLIKSSLRSIGVLASGESPTAAEQADALDILNDILEEWSNDGFMIFEEKIEEFTFTPGTGSYLIGSGAAFDSLRPQVILGAKVKKAGESYEYPIQVWNIQEWGKISLRDMESGLPDGVYYNPTFPSGTLNFWPVPDEANKILLYSIKPLSLISSASSTLSFPPGYKKALKLALASELCVEYGKPVNAKLEDMATKAKASIQRNNSAPVLMQSDAFGLTDGTVDQEIWRPYE